MVEYKKKKIVLQSGGTRNYYYKVSSDGKKKQVSKNEYLEKKGGTSNQNNVLRLSLMDRLNTLSESNNNKNQNYKNVLTQIKKLIPTSLNDILKFISTIIKNNLLQKLSVKLILKDIAEYVKRVWSILDTDISNLNDDELINCLVTLLDFVRDIKANQLKLGGDIRDIIQKIIRKILIEIIKRNIVISDLLGNKDISSYKAIFNIVKRDYNSGEPKKIAKNLEDRPDHFARSLMFDVYYNH